MDFSSLAQNLAAPKNPLYTLHDALTRRGETVINLVSGNVNDHGIIYPENVLEGILREAAARARIYRPDSFGQEVARQAIAAFYRNRFAADRILLTPGTSVSYWYCFKLLAEPGDEILTPLPSYPLFDYIAEICGVRLVHYRLREEQDWRIDLEDLESQISTKTRAIVLISPHNPTGMVAGEEQLTGLAAIAARHEIAVISDEVFSEFLFGLDDLPRVAATEAPLVFTLNGLSKMFALPGMKIGWIGVSGDDALVRQSLEALELISDTFLPVNEIAQFAVPLIFERGQEFLKKYREWVAGCRSAAMEELRGCSLVEPRGGFYVTIRLGRDEEAVAEALLRDDHILTHPGFFYDIRPDHLVLTFVYEQQKLREALRRIAEASR